MIQIALDTVIDNVAALAVERCLLHDLSKVFPFLGVADIDDDTISRIASEPIEAREERSRLTTQATTLEDVIRILQVYNTGGSGRSAQRHLLLPD